MKIVLVTTTINVPEVLKEYRRVGPDVQFIIAGDKKTPHEALTKFAGRVGKCNYLHPEHQESKYPNLSRTIGWNCIQRRNIAILEALRLRPDVIVTIDDDNAPKEASYFEDIESAFTELHRGAVAGSEWFNVGELAHSPYRYRGLPYEVNPTGIVIATNEQPHKLGVVNGLIYGDPDINALERIERAPEVDWYHETARDGITLLPRMTWSPINSQNTAWSAALAPLMLLPPELGRYDDIWGSYIAQAVLAATDFCVRFGRPFVQQERNDHDVYRDLEEEIFGMRHTQEFVNHLKRVSVDRGATVLQNLRTVLTSLQDLPFPLPHDFFSEWLRACESLA